MPEHSMLEELQFVYHTYMQHASCTAFHDRFGCDAPLGIGAGCLEKVTNGGFDYYRLTEAGYRVMLSAEQEEQKRRDEEAREYRQQSIEQKRHQENLLTSWVQFFITTVISIVTTVLTVLVDRQTGFVDLLLAFIKSVFH